ncbi:SulP family inorganic anion transporter [Peptoclostridium sp. AF21-18]|uniref:SulP family inorganic anion transporter n=1 Tax=Peptoclostridium sp. AF21-18 TaxID=2292243 RepID=UPI000E47428B|nr:sulfate permease [Peptoclostridium sp. AF21-18]RHQ97744.1 STAS domain-containing protein [Peptoclostridium sp. AF21-18]
MRTLRPELVHSMKGYSAKSFTKDLTAGIIVAIIALPLSIALALASGVRPEQGIYTAIIAGFLISALGGSKVQIAGPTAAFASIVAGIVATDGMDGLVVATILAGIFLILMGIFKMGNLIKFIPYTITTGFTSGIAVTIFIGQVKDFLGLTFENSPIETIEKVAEIFRSISTINTTALLVGVISLAILIIWPHISKKIPGSLIAVLVSAALVKVMDLNVNTIGDLYTISSSLPHFTMPTVTYDTVRNVLPDAFTIAVLAAIESLLSCVVADGMIGSRHNSNMELVAQGIGNTASALFGGIPATGAIARTAANIKNGGRSPIAGMVHAIVLLITLLLLMPYAALIPMPCIAAILFMVAYNMSEWREFVDVIKESPKSDIMVLVATFTLTVVFDLVIAIGFGLVLASVLFMRRMADVTDVYGWKYIEEEDENYDEDSDTGNISLRYVPKDVLVFEITGPMFFGAADKINNVIFDKTKKAIILRMRSVPAMDTTSLNKLRELYAKCKKYNVVLIFSHVNEQPLQFMEKSGFIDDIGRENVCPSIDTALERAESI